MTEAINSELTKSKSFDIVTHPNGIFRLEYNKWIAILHLKEMSQLTPTVYRWAVDKVNEIADFTQEMGYPILHAAIPEDNIVVNKMILRVGFVYKDTLDGYNMYERNY